MIGKAQRSKICISNREIVALHSFEISGLYVMLQKRKCELYIFSQIHVMNASRMCTVYVDTKRN